MGGIAGLRISGAAAHEHAGYPDRHVIHHRIAASVVPGLPASCGFLLVDTISEAYQPVLRMLATGQIRAGVQPFRRTSAPRPLSSGTIGRVDVSGCSHALRSQLERWLRCDAGCGLAHARTGSGGLPATMIVFEQVRAAQKFHASSLSGAWKVFHSDQTMRVPPKLIAKVAADPCWLIVHVLPESAKLGDDPPPALIIGHTRVLDQLKNLGNVVWYNMDYIHRGLLLRRLAILPAFHTTGAARLAPEARRTPTRLRFDFNETRTHTSDEVQREIEQVAAGRPHASLVAEAQRLLTERHGAEAAIELFRGANEAIKACVLAIARPGCRLLLPDVTYIGHVKAAVAAQAQIQYLQLGDRLLRDIGAPILTYERLWRAIEAGRPEIVMLANPSNPLGELLDEAEFERLFKDSQTLHPRPIFIIDAAFEQFAVRAGRQVPDYGAYLRSDRLIVIESLSKADGYAGSRAGYVYGGSHLVRRLTQSRWHPVPISPLGAATIVVSRNPENAASVRATVDALQLEVARFKERFVSEFSAQSREAPHLREAFGGFLMLKAPEEMRDKIVLRLRSLANLDVSLVPRFFETASEMLLLARSDVCGAPLQGLLRISMGRREENERLFEVLTTTLLASSGRCGGLRPPQRSTSHTVP